MTKICAKWNVQHQKNIVMHGINKTNMYLTIYIYPKQIYVYHSHCFDYIPVCPQFLMADGRKLNELIKSNRYSRTLAGLSAKMCIGSVYNGPNADP